MGRDDRSRSRERKPEPKKREGARVRAPKPAPYDGDDPEGSKREAKALFVDVLRALAEDASTRWPVNCSLVNDRMKAKEKAFDVRKTAYEKTANLVAELVEDGTLKTSRRGDNLELMTCKFLACWPDVPPASERADKSRKRERDDDDDGKAASKPKSKAKGPDARLIAACKQHAAADPAARSLCTCPASRRSCRCSRSARSRMTGGHGRALHDVEPRRRRKRKGCLSNCTGCHQSKGWLRFRCETADYDLCLKCYVARPRAGQGARRGGGRRRGRLRPFRRAAKADAAAKTSAADADAALGEPGSAGAGKPGASRSTS